MSNKKNNTSSIGVDCSAFLSSLIRFNLGKRNDNPLSESIIFFPIV